MKKSWKRLIALAVVLLIGILLYRYFNLSGSRIEGLDRVVATSEVTITRYEHIEYYEDREIFTLDEAQIAALVALLEESRFRRTLRDFLIFTDGIDRDTYDIKIIDNETRVWLMIHSTGNDYLSVSEQFNDKYLRIKNPAWTTALDQIIDMAD